ncbi:unnamed protein product, partial [Ascophyllum nodosum]
HLYRYYYPPSQPPNISSPSENLLHLSLQEIEGTNYELKSAFMPNPHVDICMPA